MSTSLSIKCHLPLITARIEFQFNVLSPPPQITPHRDLGAVICHQAWRTMPYYPRSNCENTPIAGTTHHTESPLIDIVDSESDELSVDTSLLEGVEVTSSHKILKPKGEAGRSVEAITCKLLWVGKMKNLLNSPQVKSSMFQRIIKLPYQQKYINNEAGKKLDIKICYSKQKHEDLDKVVQSVQIWAMFQMFS